MTRKPKSSGEVIGRVAAALIECPLTADEVRSLERLEVRRQEADAEQLRATTQDQKARAYAKAAKCGEDAVELMQRVNARRDARWSSRALKELDALADLRGEEFETTQVGARLRITPLMRLAKVPKDTRKPALISPEEFAAGMRYGMTWQRLYGGAKGEQTGDGTLDPLESRLAYLKRLDEARGYARFNASDMGGRQIVETGLGGDARLISLIDTVCGQEQSIRQAVGTSPHKRKVAMGRLKLGLGLLALHYGLIRVRDDELRAA